LKARTRASSSGRSSSPDIAPAFSLEDAFWRRLRRIAAERGLSLNRLAAMVDASRGGANLSSAIRVFVLEAEGALRGNLAADAAARLDQ
jgi:predicted DNA-binding ribbon-helix-helix protein